MDLLAFVGAYLVVIVIVQGLLAIIPAYVADQRGRSFVAFWWLSFFLTVFIGLLVALALPILESPKRRLQSVDSVSNGLALEELPEEVKCPRCAEYIKFEAKVCRFCGENVENEFAKIAEAVARTKAKREAAELEASAARQREDEARENHAQFVKLERRQKLARLVKRRITWVIAVALVALAFPVYWGVSASLENQRLEDARAAQLAAISQQILQLRDECVFIDAEYKLDPDGSSITITSNSLHSDLILCVSNEFSADTADGFRELFAYEAVPNGQFSERFAAEFGEYATFLSDGWAIKVELLGEAGEKYRDIEMTISARQN